MPTSKVGQASSWRSLAEQVFWTPELQLAAALLRPMIRAPLQRSRFWEPFAQAFAGSSTGQSPGQEPLVSPQVQAPSPQTAALPLLVQAPEALQKSPVVQPLPSSQESPVRATSVQVAVPLQLRSTQALLTQATALPLQLPALQESP